MSAAEQIAERAAEQVAEQDDVMRRLVARNRQATIQRRIVLQALMDRRSYVTARELYAALHEEHPSIGQATVYRTLELLVEAGAAARFPQENNESKYIYCPVRHHHHLVCTRCGLVEDIEGCVIPALGATLEKRTRFQINEHAVTFYGFCGDCKTR
ncbi:MAG TPA: transcriptional repressor [Chloroflexota bacterium]|nr:transcriptional repressor [Chloroflexota bacterium]